MTKKRTKTDRVLGSLKGREKRTPIADDMFLPNNSGDHQKSIKRNTPTGTKDLVNKEYVDGQFPVTHASTTGQTTDDHHAESHSIASHSDTTATGAEMETLTDDSMADTLHRHSELSASDGTPDQALVVDTAGKVGIGTATPACKLDVDGAISSGKINGTSSDALNVSGCNVIKCDATAGNITIGGFAGGVVGQVVHLIKSATANNVIIEHNEGTGTQKIITPDGVDITLTNRGGVTLVCAITNYWHVVSQ